MFTSKFRDLSGHVGADKALSNKEEIINFFLKYQWTVADMTSYQWYTTQFGEHCYGQITNKKLRNCNGIMIIGDGRMWIAHWDGNARETRPMIVCKEKEFRICE